MGKIVQVSGGPRVSFPDDTSEEQISDILSRDFPAPFPESKPVPIPGVPGASGTYDDNLVRAARDFQGLQSIGMAGYNQPGPPSVAAQVGRGFQLAGQAVKASLADLGDLAFADVIAQFAPPADKGEPPTNVAAFANDQPLPAETQLKVLPRPLEVAGRAAQGIVGSAPQMGAVLGAEAAGVPPWVSGPLVFGSTPEGFDPKQAAIAAALPFVGRFGGEITGRLADKLGVTSTEAQNIWRGLGGATAAATALAGIDAARIAKLPSDKRNEAMVEAVANVFSQLALGPAGVKFKQPGAGEVAGAMLGEDITQSISNPAAVEAAAAAGPEAIVQPGAAPSGAPGGAVTPENLLTRVFPEPKPPVEPKPVLDRLPGNKFRPEVPEGPPAQERLTILEEIRRAGARTTRQVQELFAKSNLSREQAAQYRRQAWEERPGQEVTADQGETEPPAPGPVASASAPPEESPAQLKERTIKERIKAGIDPKNVRIAVFKDPAIPAMGVIQVDETHPKLGNTFSSNPEQLRALGFDVPATAELMTLPAGKYSLSEARALLEKQAAPVGAAFTVSTPIEGAKVKGHYDVVDATALTTSQDMGFDPSLQPRDRARVASQQQVANIIRTFEPQRLGSSATSDLGAPMVDQEGQVLSGNGRTMALRQKYLADKGQDYRDWLVQNAKEFGLDPEAISQMHRPVLVRRITDYGGLDKAEFARQSNQQQVAGMSEAEKAAADARMVAGAKGLLELFRPGDEGNVLASSNRDFLNAFIKGTGDQNELLSKEGYNGPVLAKRVRNAVLGAFIGPENRPLLNQLLEEADTLSLKTVSNAILQAAPALMRFKGTAYDLSSVSAQALKDLVHLRSTGEKLDEFLENQPLFTDPQRTADSDLLLAHLHQARSAKALAEGLARYAAGADEALKTVQSGDIFGAQPASRRNLIAQAYAKPQSQAAQANLPVGQSQPAPGPGGSPAEPPGPPAGQEPAAGGGPGTGQGPNAPGRPRQSEFRAPGEALELNPPQRARQAADRNLRTSQQSQNPGLQAAGRNLNQASAGGTASPKWFLGLRRMFAAATVDQDSEAMAGLMRRAFGEDYEHQRQADFAMRPFIREFDQTPVGRNYVFAPGEALPRNYEVMRAIDTGDTAALTPIERQFAGVMRQLFDHAIDLVQSVSPESLRELITNYFPRLWRDPVGNQDKINQLLSRRPWEGPKTFLRKRVLEHFTEGLELGLIPAFDNPAELAIHKLGEMYRFVATRHVFENAQAAGLRRFVYIYEKPPGPTWRQVDDPSSTVKAPPTVTVKEAYDAQVRTKTLEMLAALGVPHERLVNIGGTRWGYAESGSGKIVSKFAGPDAVLWHEFGHQMDFRYPDLREMLPARGSSTLANELRALADLRFEGQSVTPGYKDYVRQAEEKYANLFDAYLRAPAKFQATAPNVWRVFGEWLDRHPEVKNPLNEINGSLTLGVDSREMFVGGPVILGRWMMPEGAAQLVDNYLKPGLGKFKWFRTFREISGLINGIQLAGFFHGGLVENDSAYSGLSMAIYDAMKAAGAGIAGDLPRAGALAGRAVKALAAIPVSPVVNVVRGGRLGRAIENPQAADQFYQRFAQLALRQNLRAGHGNFDPEFGRRWIRAFNEFKSQPSPGAAWETLWRFPGGFVQTAMKPVMSFLVPRMKHGIFMQMAERVVSDNPNASQEELDRLLAKAADATEDRLGQVTYDNLFQMRAVKDAMQLGLRSYGWHFTKYRLGLGGAADWIKAGRELAAGRPPELTFRMTYLPAMVIGHAIIGGTMHYVLTGKRPEKLIDYLFPESGLIDAFGQPVRLAIADFVKDYAADWQAIAHLHGIGQRVVARLAPVFNMAAEMYRNQDFWGTEIFTRKQPGEPEYEHLMHAVWEGIQYMASNTQPFSMRAGGRLEQAGAPKWGQLAPLVGVIPAPLYMTQTQAQARAQEISRDNLPKEPQSKEAAARGRAEAQIVRDIRTGKINNEGQFEAAAAAAKVDPHNQREITKLRERVLWTPLQYQVHRMSVRQGMDVFDLANDQERVSLAPFLADKINNAFNGGQLDQATAHRYVSLVMPYYKRRGAPAGRLPAGPAQPAQPGKPAYSAFTPQQ